MVLMLKLNDGAVMMHFNHPSRPNRKNNPGNDND